MRADPRRGIVLVTVLWTIALLAALAMAASMTFRSFTGVMSVDQKRLRADALVSAGGESAAAVLARLGDRPLQDMSFTIALPSGSVLVRLSDERGRIDIGRAPAELLTALFRSAGVQPADRLAQSLAEWRKAQVAVQAPAQNAQAPASPQPAPGGGGNPDAASPFTDLHQLAEVPGFTAGMVAAIAPLATVFGAEKINPMTAPADVLAVVPGLDPKRVAAFLDARRVSPKQADGLIAQLDGLGRFFDAKAKPVAAVEITAQVNGTVAQSAKAVMLAVAGDKEPYRLLSFTPVAARGSDDLRRED
jgi:general secretion pathway protein K